MKKTKKHRVKINELPSLVSCNNRSKSALLPITNGNMKRLPNKTLQFNNKPSSNWFILCVRHS